MLLLTFVLKIEPDPCLLLPSSSAAEIVIAFVSPIPFIFLKTTGEILPS